MDHQRPFITHARIHVKKRCQPNRGMDRLLEGLVQLLLQTHLDEQEHPLVLVLWSTLAHTNCIVDVYHELWPLEYTVNLSGAEAHT